MKILAPVYKTMIVFWLLFISCSAAAQFWSPKKPALLPSEEAFAVAVTVDDSGLLKINWSIANDYYMYRDQFDVQIKTEGVDIGEISYPKGKIEDDPEFGEVEVYFYYAELSAPLIGNSQSSTLQLTINGQGCNKPVGICYPPIIRDIEIPFSASVISKQNQPRTNTDQASIKKSFFSYVFSAFIAGILLSFTPCVLPMVPILAGVIARQKSVSRTQSGWLAICYVAGTITTYVAAGVLAGATGAQLQAYFQNPWVVGAIIFLLLLLAASLFGFFKVELPSKLQSALNSVQSNSQSAAISSYVLGLISALVVGACVSPVLIFALGAAITQGDPVLGGAIMGSMALGMGLLLIAFGFGAGWLLPRTGVWMNQIQVLFGFMVLGVAIYLLSTIMSSGNLYFWAALLLCAGFYIEKHVSKIQQIALHIPIRAIGFGLIVWGAMAVIGGSLKGTDILNPLSNLQASAENSNSGRKLAFNTTTKLEEVQTLLAQAKQQQKPVLLDFYAKWCLECKRMHRTTFVNDGVIDSLKGWQVIEVDVTDTSNISEQVKRHFDVFGPPATLFFAANGEERSDLRQYGYIGAEKMLELISDTEK